MIPKPCGQTDAELERLFRRTDSATDKFLCGLVDILTRPELMPLHAAAAKALTHPESMTGIERAVLIVANPERRAEA